jgi:hypothetical protein
MIDSPTFMEKVKIDYWLMTSTFVILIYIVIGTMMIVMVPDEPYVPYIFFGFALISVIVSFFRSKVIDRYFDQGDITSATIEKIRLFSRYPFFKVNYQYNNEHFTRKIYVVRNRQAKEYKAGETIKILVLKDNPKKAIIFSFYDKI